MSHGTDASAAEAAELEAELARLAERRALGPRPGDPPWIEAGWLERASAWMVERMAALGHPPSEPPSIVYVWGISFVLRAPSPAGAMYFKCPAPVFHQEAVLTQAISRAVPDLVVRVAAIEPGEGWLLMHDLGGPRLGDAPPETWGSGLVRHATIQRALAGRTDELLAAGMPERSLADLARVLPTLADDGPLADQLTGDDLADWHRSMPRFLAACARLADLGPPPTLVHGDLHPWNVADAPDGPRVFDWTDAAISHPFTDLAVYATRADDPAIRRALRDDYLACWSEILPPDALTEAGELAIVVGTLYQVAGYVRLVKGIPPDDLDDLADALGSWARAAIDSLDDGLDLRRRGHADG
jgi:hypothetical protein